MGKIQYFLVVFLLVALTPGNAQIQLLENKGQYPEQFKFVGNIPSGRVFFSPAKLTYEFVDFDPHNHYDQDGDGLHGHEEESSINSIQGHVYEIEFLNAHPQVSVVGKFPEALIHNYFVGDSSKWAVNVHDYQVVEYQGLYTGINMAYYKYGNTVKYDLVIEKGGNPEDIKFKLNGLYGFHIDEVGDLNLISSVSMVKETRPVTYQLKEGKKIYIPSQFKLNGNILSFELLDDYDPCLKLIIDPTLIFSTYSGSTADNWGNTATFDEQGNLYSGGITNHYADGSFPATVGAFQTTTAGFWDVAIIKYDSAGTDALYATYLGGSQSEVPQSLIANEAGELYILGATGSSNFPTTGAFRDNFQGGPPIFPFGDGDDNLQFPNGSDLFITKLNTNGTSLIASTFLGGSGNDGLSSPGETLVRNYGDQSRSDIFLTSNGSVALVSHTASVDFPMENAFQTNVAGNTDALILELSTDLNDLIFSTYLGGSGNDAAYSLNENNDGKLVIGGGTSSNDLNDFNGQFSQNNFGGIDGWLAQIDRSTYQLDTGIYIGTTSYDQLYFLGLDTDDNIFVYGQTAGIFPIVGNVFNSGDGQFVQKYSPLMDQLLLSTEFGSPRSEPDISPTAFLVNDCDNIYLSGWGGATNNPDFGYNGGSTNGMPVTSDALQSTTSGNDFYLMTLTADLSEQLYGTFLGGTQSNTHVDGGTSRFDKSGIVYHAVCAGCGQNSDFPVTPGAFSSTNNSRNCNNAAFKFDLATLRARIQTNTFVLDNPGISNICFPDLVVFENLSIGGVDYEWDLGDGTTFSTQDTSNIVHQYERPGRFRVTLKAIDRNTCLGEDIAAVTVNINDPLFTVQDDEQVCEGDQFELNASGAVDYFWFNQDSSFQSTERNPIIIAEASETYFVSLLDGRGCDGLDTVNIEVIPAANVNFELMRNFDCFSRPSITLNNISTGSENYLFDLGDGQTSDLDQFIHTYENDGIYKVRLVATNEFCVYEKTDSVRILTLKTPNVITPNGDGVNDTFEVVTSLPVNISILNRWGREVYSEENYQSTWSGEEEPSGVYYYEAEVIGETTCKGWVQILK